MDDYKVYYINIKEREDRKEQIEKELGRLKNDDEDQFENMVKWIAGELNKNIPLHISRYFPQHEKNVPATPVSKLEILYNLAKQHLNHVIFITNFLQHKLKTYTFFFLFTNDIQQCPLQ